MTTLPQNKCRAKNPATCWKHGTLNSPAGSIKTLLNKATEVEKTQSDPYAPEAIFNQALNSTLKWEGEKPSWWKKYSEEIESHPNLSNTPQLIDVIDTPEGQMAVVWQEQDVSYKASALNIDSGFNSSVCYLKSFETGEIFGYFRLGSVDNESLKRSFGDDEFANFRWAERFTGSSYGLKDYSKEEKDIVEYQNLEGEELLNKRREVWLKTIKYNSSIQAFDNDGQPIFSSQVNAENIPDDQTVKKNLDSFSRTIQKDIDKRTNFFTNPYVDFARVEEPLKGKNYGSALYIYSARLLGKEGKILRGSTAQSGDAESVWARFRKKLPNNVKDVKIKSYTNEKVLLFPTLDFRGQ